MFGIKESGPPAERDLLVAFFDLTYYQRYASTIAPLDTFRLFAEYFELVGGIVEGAGGSVIKFIGDAGLLVFPEESAP